MVLLGVSKAMDMIQIVHKSTEPVESTEASDENKYYRQSRKELLRFIPSTVGRLIDIGCGEGRFGEAIKERFPFCETWGVEPVEAAAVEAARRNDHVISKSLDDAAADIPSEYFDVVTMNDVLEHLPYSEPALRVVKRILRLNGLLVISLPNVRYYLNVRDLVFKNDWKYQDCGILDRTHFRFFTTKSATRLLVENGFEIILVRGLSAPRLKLHYRAIFALAPKFFEWMRYPQFAIVSHPI
jgi:SAM-dependent methyltransferase